MKRKMLVLGGTGFIGRNLWECFSENDLYEVYATYRREIPAGAPASRVKFMAADLTCARDVARAVRGMDIVLQAAATTSGAKDIVEKPYLHVAGNAVMNALLFRACYEARVRHLVFFSCTTVYLPQDEPVREEDFRGEVYDKYFGGGWTKVYNEKMCEFYSRIGETKYTVIRHSNIYGPHDKFDLEKSHVFGATVAKVMNAADGKIIVWGDGSEERDLLHVDDLMDFVEKVLRFQQKKFELINVGSGESVSVADLVRKIVRASGKNLEISFDRAKPSIGFKIKLNIEKAMSEYRWRPAVSLEEGIRRTLAWYRAHQLEKEKV